MSGNEGLRSEEQLACDVVASVLDISVEPWDIGKKQGAVEAILHYKDGSGRAAFEVTIVGDQDELHLARLLYAKGPMWPVRSNWWWTVGLGDVRDLPVVERSLQDIIDACESQQVLRPNDLPRALISANPDFSYIVRESSTRVTGNPGAAGGSAFVRQAGRGGSADRGGTTLAPALEQWLDGDKAARKLRKLQNSQEEELHLFLLVTLRGLDFSPIDALMTEGVLPQAPLRAREGLTHLWVLPPVGRRVLMWSEQSDWTECAVPDDIV